MRICSNTRKGIAYTVVEMLRILKDDPTRLELETGDFIQTMLKFLIAQDREREDAGLPPVVVDADFLALYDCAEEDLRLKHPELFARIILTQ